MAFANGNVETHFIDNYKEDLFPDANNSVSVKEACEAARLNASLVAACLIEKEHFILARNRPGKFPFLLCNVLSSFLKFPWYLHLYAQGEAAYPLYGILLHLLEFIIKLSVEWHLSGIMNMLVIAQRS